MNGHDLFRVASSSASSVRTVQGQHQHAIHGSVASHPFDKGPPPLQRAAIVSSHSRSSSLVAHQPFAPAPHAQSSNSHTMHFTPPNQTPPSATQLPSHSHFVPVPPSRTSSLPVPRSPDPCGVPSVQVIHATPTKNKKARRRSFGGPGGPADVAMGVDVMVAVADSTSSSSSSAAAAAPLFGATSGSAAARSSLLEVKMEEMLEDQDEEDSEDERTRVEEARKARAREKGRERQRRKRERDKQAKEVLKASATLPIPARNPSAPDLTVFSKPLSLSMPHSTPSSVSSTYSPLPTTSGYYTLSPGQNFALSASSLSGQSSPSVLFSPAISTPGMGYCETAMSTEGSTSNLDLNAMRPRSKTRPRGKTTSGTSASTRRPSAEAGMLLIPTGQSTSTGSTTTTTIRNKLALLEAHRPEKRRKSEPEPEEFKQQQVGLGVSIGGVSADFPMGGGGTNSGGGSADRPKVRRTASDGQVLTTASTLGSFTTASAPAAPEWPMRSPTPPPLPPLPPQEQQQQQQQHPTTTTPPDTLAEVLRPSSAGSLFAASVISCLVADQAGQVAQRLRTQLGVGPEELESMRADMAMMFDRWRLEKGMSKVSLEDKPYMKPSASMDSVTSTSTHVSTDHTATAASPSQNVMSTAQNTSFVTPTTDRTRSRQTQYNAQESPLAQVSVGTQGHGRQRSLSSASMLSRGLVINSQLAQALPGPGSQPSATGTIHSQQNLYSPATGTKASDSPTMSNLQTPTTGQAMNFQVPQPLEGSTIPTMPHWGSATDPSHMRFAAVGDPPDWSQPHTSEAPGLESPLAMTGKSAAYNNSAIMGPTMPVPRDLSSAAEQPSQQQQQAPQHAAPPPAQPSFAHPPCTDPQPYTPAARGHMRQTIPFTPPTPMPLKGGTAPMYYHPTFSMNGQPTIHGTPPVQGLSDGSYAAHHSPHHPHHTPQQQHHHQQHQQLHHSQQGTPTHMPPSGHHHHPQTPLDAVMLSTSGAGATGGISPFVMSPVGPSPVPQMPASAAYGTIPHPMPIPGDDGNVFGGYAYPQYPQQ